MRKIKVIINPKAGKIRNVLPKIVNKFKENKIDFELINTNSPGEAVILAKKAAEDKNLCLLLVAGGDGTVNEAVNGLANSALPLAIIPAGSLNCIAKEIKISLDPVKALSQILQGETKTIPLGKISFLDENNNMVFNHSKERYFLLMAGIGVDAGAVFNLKHKLKKIIGPLAYIYSGLVQIFFKKHPPVEIEINKKHITGYSCIINKMKTYAWFDFAPLAGIEKEIFQVSIYKKNDILSLLRYSIGSMFGWNHYFPDVESILSSKIKLSSDETVYIQVDGEAAGKLPAEISIVPNALKIVVPKI